jgi:Elongation factor P, C-terminal
LLLNQIRQVTQLSGKADKGTSFQKALLDVGVDGVEVSVPEFIKEGDEILVGIKDLKYISRV